MLERLSQYLEHGIRPPASWASMRARYDAAVKKRRIVKQREERSKLARVIALWQKRVAWWSKRYRYPKNFRYGRHPRAKRAMRMRGGMVASGFGRGGGGGGRGGRGRGRR